MAFPDYMNNQFQLPTWGATPTGSVSSPAPAGASPAWMPGAQQAMPALAGNYNWQSPTQTPWASPTAQSFGENYMGMYGQQPQTQTPSMGYMDMAKIGMGGLQTLGNLWGAWQSNNLANKSFNFQRDMANRNLANTTAAYNSRMTDHANTLASLNSWSDKQKQDYITQNRL